MNRFSSLAVSLLMFAGTAAFAGPGTYIEQTSSISAAGTALPPVTTKTWVDGDVIRKDDPRTGMVMLLNTKKGSITGVQPAQKTWWKLPDSALTEFGAMSLIAYGIKQQNGKLVVPDKIFEKTGASKTVKVRVPAGEGKDKEIEVKCNEVKVNIDMGKNNAQMAGLKSSLWMGVVPGYDPSIERTRMTMFMGTGPEAEAFLKQWDALGGIPVITETTIPTPQGTATIVETVVKVAPQKVRPEDVAVPKGFKQVEDPLTQLKRQQGPQGMPGMGGMPTPGSGN